MTHLRVVTKARRRPRLVTCTACNGVMESVAVTVRNLHGPDSEGIEQQHVECGACNSTGKTTSTRCVCCGAEGKYLCAACRLDPAHQERNVYLASLRCAVRDAAAVLAGELQEAWEPSSTLAPCNGHSEECWTRLPGQGIDLAVKARCPKCREGR